MNLSTNMLNGYVGGLNSNSSAAQAERMKSKASGINSDSSYEDIEDAAKQFEAYMLESVIKEFKKSLDDMKEDSDDQSVSQMTDIYMDQTLSTIAEQMVSQYGQRLTKDLADQMARNVGVEIPGEKKAEVADESTDTDEELDGIDDSDDVGEAEKFASSTINDEDDFADFDDTDDIDAEDNVRKSEKYAGFNTIVDEDDDDDWMDDDDNDDDEIDIDDIDE